MAVVPGSPAWLCLGWPLPVVFAGAVLGVQLIWAVLYL